MRVRINNTQFGCTEGSANEFLFMLVNIKAMYGRDAIVTTLKLFNIDETKAKRLADAMP